jgi:RHS repeat-associated protein
VDLATGKFSYTSPAITIGQPGAGGLSYATTYDSGIGWRDNLSGTINQSGSIYTVSVGGASESFAYSGVFTSQQRLGSTMVTGGPGVLYTTSDGTVYAFEPNASTSGPDQANTSLLSTVTRPDGEVLTYAYDRADLVYGFIFYGYFYRPASITSSLGYRIVYSYSSNDPVIEPMLGETADAWSTLLQVELQNLAFDEPAGGWPSLTFAGYFDLPTAFTDTLNRTTSLGYGASGNVEVVQSPEGRAVGVQYYLSGSNAGRVYTATDGERVWTYSYQDVGNIRTTTVLDPKGDTRVVTSTIAASTIPAGLVVSDTNEVGKTTSYGYDSYGRLEQVTLPEGNYTHYVYDDRGNVTETREAAKPGTGLADIVTRASFPSSCTYPKSCNKPTYVEDARGYRTDFDYADSTHGGVESITLPAPAGAAPYGSGVRPQTRFSYNTVQAYYNGAGGWTTGAVNRLVEISACATLSSCDGALDETVTTLAYENSSTPNNALPKSSTTAAGNGAVSSTTKMTYTPAGDVETVDGPLADTADTTRYYYDTMRQPTGVVGPDPDGGGSLLRRAVRTHYRLDGQVDWTETGTTTHQGDDALANSNFSVLARSEMLFDGQDRPNGARAMNGSTVLSLTQVSYDAFGRPECSALRMNPAELASPPTSACTLDTAGSFGPDRVAKTVYDDANRVESLLSAVGVAGLEQTTATTTYTYNGLPATLTDAAGNITMTEYDGFDRVQKIRYPNATGGGASTTDYEEFAYDVYGRLASERRRDGSTFFHCAPPSFTTCSYDNLGRATFRDAPGSQPDVATEYDLFGRVTAVCYASSPGCGAGHTIRYVYDALDRLVSEDDETWSGAVGHAYSLDAAGLRATTTWPSGGLSATSVHNVAGDLTSILENGSTSLAAFTYDNLGRRTSLNRGAGAAVTSYDYHPNTDHNQRGLKDLDFDLPGTNRDQSIDFAYSPSGQIASRTRSNSAYDWITTSASTSYTDNGLNQYTAVGGIAVGYDGRGNFDDHNAGAGGDDYAFDADGRLLSAPGGVSFSYDPLGRLFQVVSGGATTRFLYDGATVIAELDGAGNVLRRYVHGPGVDEPLVWYEGSSLSDRRWLVADERGSIIAVSSSAGVAVNRYDEYGVPAQGNTGRFGFTGQMWLAEAGLYHFKARAYHPGLGRFLQPDPIGVAGGMNLYAYAGDDPVNARDPSGLVTCTGSRIDRGGGNPCAGMPGLGNGATLAGADVSGFGSAFLDSLVLGSGGTRPSRVTRSRACSGGDDCIVIVAAATPSNFFCVFCHGPGVTVPPPLPPGTTLLPPPLVWGETITGADATTATDNERRRNIYYHYTNKISMEIITITQKMKPGYDEILGVTAVFFTNIPPAEWTPESLAMAFGGTADDRSRYVAVDLTNMAVEADWNRPGFVYFVQTSVLLDITGRIVGAGITPGALH